jgi:hypothetical protein
VIGLKSKAQPFVAYKKYTSLAKINIGSKQKDGNGFSNQMEPKSKEE